MQWPPRKARIAIRMLGSRFNPYAKKPLSCSRNEGLLARRGDTGFVHPAPFQISPAARRLTLKSIATRPSMPTTRPSGANNRCKGAANWGRIPVAQSCRTLSKGRAGKPKKKKKKPQKLLMFFESMRPQCGFSAINNLVTPDGILTPWSPRPVKGPCLGRRDISEGRGGDTAAAGGPDKERFRLFSQAAVFRLTMSKTIVPTNRDN